MFGRVRRALLALVVYLVSADAHRLPIQIYTTSQGLPRNTAACLVPDPNGLLWVCTSEGLVRFDGSEFRTFGTEQGLPSPSILDFLIARDGSYWVLTGAGVCHIPRGANIGTRCQVLASSAGSAEYTSDSLVEAPDGNLWVATQHALYRANADRRTLERVYAPAAGESIRAAGRGPSGHVLLSTDRAMYLWDGSNARALSSGVQHGCGFGAIHYASDRDIWVVSECGPLRLAGSIARGDLRFERAPLAKPGPYFPESILRRRDGTLWLSIAIELQRVDERPDGGLEAVEHFGKDEGVPPGITRLAEDMQGNLWGSSEGRGLVRVTAAGFRSYSEDDGLGNARISSVFEDMRGELCVTSGPANLSSEVSHLRVKNGDRFETVGIRPAPGFQAWGWGWNQFGLQAHDGEWWFPSGQGLYRYGRTATARDLTGHVPMRVYDRDEDGAVDEVFRVFEDSRGDIWFTSVSHNRLISWNRESGRLHRWTAAEGWPKDAIATVIRESRSGVLWIGTFREVVRLVGGRLEKVYPAASGEFSVVRDLYVDRGARLWVATANMGLLRCDAPDAARPAFRRYTTREGLSALSVRSIAEDNSGLIYAGTVRGVDRIDPSSAVDGGNVRHYTAADGLPDGEQNVAFRDKRGHLWFGTLHGLAEFDPAADSPHALPRVYIRRVRVRGEEIPLPLAGAASLNLDLAADKNQIEVEYAAADLRSASSLRYQYRLQGVDSDWSAPTTRYSVNYASLPPGKRNFAVRVIGAGGEVAESMAIVGVNLAAPLWRKWWFLASALLLAGTIVYWLYNYRVRHLIAVERLRMRIATDLHDDIGASLTQISLLSEVGQRDRSRNVLSEIAQISRDLAREMSDIVWAVSPRHDRFDALAHRMRSFAEDALPDGELTFDSAGLPGDLSLPIEYRRPLFLVFKEAVNNLARHSGATRMTVRLAVTGGVLTMVVEDNGSGFDGAESSSGEGLNSIRRRLRDLGGAAEWVTERGGGTKFSATLPLRK